MPIAQEEVNAKIADKDNQYEFMKSKSKVDAIIGIVKTIDKTRKK